jgi:glycosyltransferase involved in cell wall biosynthesis
MDNLSIVIPFYDGYETIDKLISSLPKGISIIVVDDMSDHTLTQKAINREHPPEDGFNIEVITMKKKGYFAGACNVGLDACETDVLILNQDTWFDNTEWINLLEKYKDRYAFIGERIKGIHPSFGELGYAHGTFLFLRRDAIEKVGLLDQKLYPLWGNTALWQWRAARAGFEVLPLKEIPGFHHERKENEKYGSSIRELLEKEEENKKIFIRTPPLLSVIIPCHNYGRYIQDCINSLIGGKTSLGEMPPQTLQSFEVIIVDDASTDSSWEYIQGVTSLAKGIRSYRLQRNVGTAKTLNFGIGKAVGQYITFLSADDMREPESLEMLVKACEDNPHSFAYDDVWLFSRHQRIKKWIIEEYDFEKIIWKNQIHAGIVFPRKAWEDVGGYPDIMDDGREDWAFNVALGVRGWCGVHVKQYGYLYRREGQNRTETNTTERHRQQFLGKIMSLFPDIYKGERPMACCGQGGGAKKTNNGVVSNFTTGGSLRMAAQIGTQGMVKIEYTGQKMASTWYGDVTNAPYEFGKDRKRGWVDKRDVGSKEDKKGFLSKQDDRKNFIFKVVTEGEAVEETVSKKPQAEPVLAIEGIPVVDVVEQPETEVAVGNLQGHVVGVASNRFDSSPPPKPVTIDPSELNVEQVKGLELDREGWEQVYKDELAGRSRKGLITFLEEKIANWPT